MLLLVRDHSSLKLLNIDPSELNIVAKPPVHMHHVCMILALHFPTAGEDYLDVSTTHSLSSHGDAESVKLQCFAVKIVDDFVTEDRESFSVFLTTNSHVVSPYSSSTVVIFDDDKGIRFCYYCWYSVVVLS